MSDFLIYPIQGHTQNLDGGDQIHDPHPSVYSSILGRAAEVTSALGAAPGDGRLVRNPCCWGSRSCGENTTQMQRRLCKQGETLAYGRQ